MWRRVASLSQMISSSSRSLASNQAASGLKLRESFATEIIKPGERISPPKEKAPFITFVLGNLMDFKISGGPGSGKGTQCEKIVETFGLTHLSAGDLLRREIALHTKNGAMILNLIKDGKIVPSEVTVKLIQKELESSDSCKFLIDGFPRTEENRVAFERIIGSDPDVVLFFDCPEEEMVKRVLNRNQGRVDDNITTMRKRLKIFEALNRPVIEYYKNKGKLYTINAVGTVDDIFQQVLPIFTPFEQLKQSRHVNPKPPIEPLLSLHLSIPNLCIREKEDKKTVEKRRMVSIVHKPNFCYPSVSSSSMKKKPRHYEQLKQNQLKHNSGFTSLSFTKPSPNPILIGKQSVHRTKLEALDSVITDLETSARKGITISEPEIFASLLETCYSLRAIDHGVRVHRLVPVYLLRNNLGISSKLVRLYASCGYAEVAHEVFDRMSKRKSSAFAWNSLISGYAESGQYEDAMALYFQMAEEGVKPDRFTFPRVLKACGGIGSIHIGEAIHRDLVKEGYGYDVYVLNALVDMYAKCGDIVKGRNVFDMIPHKDYVSWNSMLTSYLHHGLLHEAVHIFRLMVQDGIEPDKVAISSVLARVLSFKHGRQLHGWAIRRGMECELSVANALIVLYSKRGHLGQACFIFDQMVERD
ncbi:unnamed protein product, partial [Thlaspi arvense]